VIILADHFTIRVLQHPNDARTLIVSAHHADDLRVLFGSDADVWANEDDSSWSWSVRTTPRKFLAAYSKALWRVQSQTAAAEGRAIVHDAVEGVLAYTKPLIRSHSDDSGVLSDNELRRIAEEFDPFSS
jgi:hypothetical protein